MAAPSFSPPDPNRKQSGSDRDQNEPSVPLLKTEEVFSSPDPVADSSLVSSPAGSPEPPVPPSAPDFSIPPTGEEPSPPSPQAAIPPQEAPAALKDEVPASSPDEAGALFPSFPVTPSPESVSPVDFPPSVSNVPVTAPGEPSLVPPATEASDFSPPDPSLSPAKDSLPPSSDLSSPPLSGETASSGVLPPPPPPDLPPEPVSSSPSPIVTEEIPSGEAPAGPASPSFFPSAEERFFGSPDTASLPSPEATPIPDGYQSTEFPVVEPIVTAENQPPAESLPPENQPLIAPEPLVGTVPPLASSPSVSVEQNVISPPPPKKKKWWLLLLLLLLLFGLGFWLIKTFFFKNGASLTGQPVELVYWGLWEDEAILREVFDQWTKDHPQIKIRYERQNKEEYRERLQSALARGEGPDIFRFHNTWLPMFSGELSALPSDIMNSTEFNKTFYPVAATDLRSGSSLYGLPLEIDTLALFYNEEIFANAGKQPPDNWNDLRTLASELTVRDDRGQIQIAGAAMGGVGNIDHWSDILGLMMLQNGVDLTQPTGKLAEDTLSFYNFFLTRDQVWDETLPASTAAFAGGKLAMYFGFSWDVFEIQRLNPDLKFKIVPVPQLPERQEVNWASYWVEGVSKRSSHTKEAWQFLQFLTQPETMRKVYQLQSLSRSFGEPYSRQDLAAELATDPLVNPFLKQAATARSWYLTSRTFDNGLDQAMIKYFEDAVNSMTEDGDATSALSALSQGVTQVLTRYQVAAQK